MHVKVWDNVCHHDNKCDFKVSDQKLNDGEWHQMVLRCEDGQPIKTFIDKKAGN